MKLWEGAGGLQTPISLSLISPSQRDRTHCWYTRQGHACSSAQLTAASRHGLSMHCNREILMPLLLPSWPTFPLTRRCFFSHCTAMKAFINTQQKTHPAILGPAFSVTPLQVSLLLLSTISPLLMTLNLSVKRASAKQLFLQMLGSQTLTVFEKDTGNTIVRQCLQLPEARQWQTKQHCVSISTPKSRRNSPLVVIHWSIPFCNGIEMDAEALIWATCLISSFLPACYRLNKAMTWSIPTSPTKQW